MSTRPEKISHTQLRVLRLRFDELNREFGPLRSKKDFEDYTVRVRSLVERHLKNAGFEKTPKFVDRSRRARVPIAEVGNKGNVRMR